MADANDKTDALVAQLDDYLQGCPDPNKVWPKWMVRKASRLLWACREALAEQPAASVDVERLRAIADGIDPATGTMGCKDVADLLRKLIDSAGGAKGEWRCACGDVNAANETCGLCHQPAPQPDGGDGAVAGALTAALAQQEPRHYGLADSESASAWMNY